jgi:hypothetical protein
MDKYTHQIHEKQAKSLYYNDFAHLLNQLYQDLRHGYLKAQGRRRILNALAFYDNVYEHVEVSQETIANRARVCREYANEVLEELCQRRYMTKIYRHRKVCMYILHPVFYEDLLRDRFSDILPALKIKSKKIAMSILNGLRTTKNRIISYYEKISLLKAQSKKSSHQLNLKVLRFNLKPTPMYLQGDCKGGTTGKKIEHGKLGVGEMKNEAKSEKMSMKYSWQDPIRVDHRLSVEENQQRWYGFEAECKESYVRNRGMNEFLILKRDFMIEVCKIKRT